MNDLALSARPDFAARVSALIDEGRAQAGIRALTKRAAPKLSRDKQEAAAKANATRYFALTYGIDYSESMKLKAGSQELRQWKASKIQGIALGLREIPGSHWMHGLAARLFKRQSPTPTQWHAMTGL